MDYNLVATTTFGLEGITAKELKALGYEDLTVENGKVHFEGDEMDIAIANVHLRTADRIFIKMAEFEARSFEELFQGTKAVKWSDIIPVDGVMHVVGKSVKSTLFSVPDCQSIVKKAIVTSMSESYGVSHFSEDGPVYKIEVSILKDVVTLSIDTSGIGLHKRGYREEAGNIAQRMRELGVQAGNDTLSDEDRSKIKGELTQLKDEMTKIADETKFNGKALLNTLGTFKIQAGANKETRDVVTADLSSIAKGISISTLSTASNAQSLVESIDTALSSINEARSNLGAMQNRLEYTAANLTTSTENLTAAESRIRDVDVAKEMVTLSKLNILNQASQAMVSQAKQQPESVSQLLR